MCSKKPCHTPEIVLDSTCDSLNLPLWVLQLHVSTRLRIWWRQISTLQKKRWENVLVFFKFWQNMCVSVFTHGEAQQLLDSGADADDSVQALLINTWRRRREERLPPETSETSELLLYTCCIWPKIKVEYISKSIQMLIHPLRNRPKKEDSWHHSKLPVN